MKSLRPSVIATVGPALLAVSSAVGFWFALPASRTGTGIGWSLVVGAVFGLAIFGPIATASFTRQRHSDWFARHSFRVHSCASAAMGIALGYLTACVRHQLFDGWAGFALVIVFLGAVIKTAFSDLRQARKNAA